MRKSTQPRRILTEEETKPLTPEEIAAIKKFWDHHTAFLKFCLGEKGYKKFTAPRQDGPILTPAQREARIKEADKPENVRALLAFFPQFLKKNEN